MAKDIDVILFGATGFTGKHTIPYIAKLTKSNGRSLTWGVAGRSESKLKALLEELKDKLEGTPLEKIPIIVADVKDEKSLNDMAAKARIIINCCGPFRFFGEPVVKACVEQGTHHVDVTGEPEFIETMQLKYHEAAKKKGIYIVSACGMDSIPADLGVVFLQQEFGGTLNSVNTYMTFEAEKKVSGSVINYGTWESAVYGVGNAGALRDLRRKLFPKRLPSFKPKLQVKSFPHQTDVAGGWMLPFLGADRSVIRRSQHYFYEHESKRPAQIQTYFAVKSFCYVMMFMFYGVMFALLASLEFGRNLLLKYPAFFSGGLASTEPPSEETVNNSLFSIVFYGEGWKESLPNADDQYTTPVDKAVVARVKGRNPGYGITCFALVLSALTILTEKDKLPAEGGVYPPGAAFAKTTLIKQLNEAGLTFEIVSQKDL